MADLEAAPLTGVSVDKLCEAESLFNTEVGRRIKSADKDGDGRLTTGDFRSLVWSEIEGWKAAKRLRVTLVALSVFTALILAANVAMAIGVAEISKEVRVGRDGVMTARHGGQGLVATGQATELMELGEAHERSVNDLRTIHQLILPADDGSVSIYSVERVDLIRGVSATFHLAGGLRLAVDETGMTMDGGSTGRRLLASSTTSASGVSTSASAVNPNDGYYCYGGC